MMSCKVSGSFFSNHPVEPGETGNWYNQWQPPLSVSLSQSVFVSWCVYVSQSCPVTAQLAALGFRPWLQAGSVPQAGTQPLHVNIHHVERGTGGV